jgi:hypothetical protein
MIFNMKPAPKAKATLAKISANLTLAALCSEGVDMMANLS